MVNEHLFDRVSALMNVEDMNRQECFACGLSFMIDANFYQGMYNYLMM